MKAKHLKQQHLTEVQFETDEDEWGDQVWVIRIKNTEFKFRNKREALTFAKDKVEEEFRERYIR